MLKKVLIVLLLIFFGTGLSSAVSLDVSPNSIDPGDTVKITYSGLSNGSSFSLSIKGTLDVSSNSVYRMDVNNFVMPISLSDGLISAKADNSKQLALNYEDPFDGTISSITKIGDSEDTCSITQNQGISAKTYDSMWIEGTASDGNLVNTELSFIGNKLGPDSGTISFILDGIDRATLNIICMVDSSVVVNEVIYVGGGSVNTATATPTAAATSSSGGGGGSGGGGSSSSGSVVSGVTVIDTSGSEDYSSDNASYTVYGDSTTSVDGNFTYAGSGASDAIIMYDSPGSVPSGWSLESQSYALISGGSEIKGEIFFNIPELFFSTGETDRLFIAEYSDGQWTMLESDVSGSSISANISKEGTYALMSADETVTNMSAPLQTEERSSGFSSIIWIVITGFALAVILKIKK